MGSLLKTYFFLIFMLINQFAFAKEHSFPKESGKSLLLGYGGNYPVDRSADMYRPSIYHPIIGLRHVSEDWVLGISMQFKFLKNKEDSSKLPLWTLQEEINYRVRLYHPLYLLAGGKVMYLYPVQAGKYPFKSRTDLGGPEVGVAATCSLLYFINPKLALGVYADLWRGTGSRNYEGLELGMHLVLPLPF